MDNKCGVCGYWNPLCKCTPGNGAQVMVFTPHVYEDLDVHPIEITSKRKLKEECKKRGLIAARLL